MSSLIQVAESAPDIADEKLAAYLEVAQKQRGRLLQLARRTTRCDDEAEDIVQEAFLKAFRALPKFRGDSRMDTWLHTIVRNSALDYVRNRKGRIVLSLDQPLSGDNTNPAHDLPDPRMNPEESCKRTELENVLHSGMNEVTSMCKLALERCVLQELPCRVVADDLNVSVATVKSRVLRGKRMLRSAMCHRTCRETHATRFLGRIELANA